MKTIFKSIVVAALFVAPVALAGVDDQLPKVREVVVGVSDAFVPGGFDSEADAFVVASGIFPNGCYSWKRADVKNVDDYTHEVTSVASVSQGMCIMVLVPFTKEIKLGKMVSGKHTLRFLNGDGTYLERTMSIE